MVHVVLILTLHTCVSFNCPDISVFSVVEAAFHTVALHEAPSAMTSLPHRYMLCQSLGPPSVSVSACYHASCWKTPHGFSNTFTIIAQTGLQIRKLIYIACSCRGVWLWQIRELFGRFPAGNQHKCQDCNQIWAPALEVHLRLTCQSSQGVFCSILNQPTYGSCSQCLRLPVTSPSSSPSTLSCFASCQSSQGVRLSW